MTAFNLSTFPEVCRLCLQSKHPDELAPIASDRPAYGRTLSELLGDLTAMVIPAEVERYLPSEVCSMCLEVFDFFCKYRQKVGYVHRFLVAFVQVKLGDDRPLRELFEDEYFPILLKDLDLCNKDELVVEDMIEEYSQYKIASMPMGVTAKVEDECESTTVMVEMLDVKESLLVERLLDDVGEVGGGLENIIEAESVHLLPVEGSEVGVEEVPDNVSDQVFVEELESAQEPIKKEVFHCTKCRYKTVLKRTFEAHCRLHERNDHLEGVRCPNSSCLRVFPNNEELQRHLRKDVHNLHVCDICGTALRHKHSLEIHLARHTGVPSFSCEYCSSSFFTNTELKNHVKSIHTTGEFFRCSECGSSFKSKKLLNQHLESHQERKYECLACEFSFKTKQHLRRHVVTVHQEVRFHCDHCEMSYGRKDKLRMHLERAHSIKTHFTCDICLRTFTTPSALEEHRGHHANPKPLECARCLIVHQDQRTFDRHLCISYREDYVCCERDFKCHGPYNRHMLQEHGQRTNARVRPSSEDAGRLGSNGRKLARCRRCRRGFESVAERRKHVSECRRRAAKEAEAVRGGTSEMGEEERLEEGEEEEMMIDEVEYVDEDES
uniref:Zinc finger protein 555 n=1 Tax=Culex pipiens TaxID=7175 RepID=A0A8D8I8F6_CULPI